MHLLKCRERNLGKAVSFLKCRGRECLVNNAGKERGVAIAVPYQGKGYSSVFSGGWLAVYSQVDAGEGSVLSTMLEKRGEWL